MKRVGIVGAGLGGLAAAISLAAKGYNVTVFEKNEHFGGKLMPMKVGKAHFDFGPNTITMPYVFKQVLEEAGENPEHYLEFIKLDVHTRNYFKSGRMFEFTSNVEMMKAQLKELDPYGYEQYDNFLKEINRLYHLSKDYFFPRLFTSWKDYLSPSLGIALLKVYPYLTIDQFFRRYFQNEEIIQVLNRYATYIGSSPYLTPATFALIAHLELNEGVYYVKGGNIKIAEAFVKVGKKLGVTFLNKTEVKNIQIQNGRAGRLETTCGEYDVDEIIINGDLLTQYPNLVEEKYRPTFRNNDIKGYEPSISAFVIVIETKKRFPQLRHHTVYFSENYAEEFETLFKNQAYSMNPTIYISNSSYTDQEQSPEGDNLFVLVNAPAVREDGSLQVNKEEYGDFILTQLDKELGLKEHIIDYKIVAPDDIAERFYAYRGALYGIATNNRINAFLRPYNISKDIKNISFVGGSTHPGGGSPMVTLSGLNVAKYIYEKSMGKM